MKIAARIGGSTHVVTVERHNGHYVVDVDGERHEVDAHKLDGSFYSFIMDGKSFEISVEPDGDGYHVRHGAAEQVVRFTDPSRGARESFGETAGVEQITAVMPGKVARVLVQEGDEVEAGQGLVVVEAMKMENEVPATKAGTVKTVAVEPGVAVESGAVLVEVE